MLVNEGICTLQEKCLPNEPLLTETIDLCSAIDFVLGELEPNTMKGASTILRGLDRANPH